MNYKKIFKILQLYDYISFDIFDTLIKRDVVEPKDVFTIVEKKLYNMNMDICGYKEKRMKAEKIAREKAETEEITLSIIYDFFERENSKYSKSIISLLKEIEEKTEIEVSNINLNMKPVLEYCVKHNKKIILISDMYLEKDTIAKILAKNNICEGREYLKLFVSSEIGCTKRSGKLYDTALKYLNISAKNLLHIGDSLRSDYLMPIKKGIKSYHIPTVIDNTNYGYLKSEGTNKKYYELWLDTFISNRILKINNDYERFGYECVGPLLYDFSIWLHSNFKKNNYKNLNFLSREGLLLQKAFKIIYPEEETRYLCVSRKSIIGAILCKADSLEERLKMIKVPHAFDRKVVTDLLGLQPEECKSCVNMKDNRMYYSIDEVIQDKEFFGFLKSADSDIIIESEKQMELLERYLKFNEEFEDVCIVDIGWNGTMQYYLGKLLEYTNQNKKIQGYYVGVSKVSKNKYLDLYNYGYLFEKEPNDLKIDENKLFSFCGLFESIFTANHGSVKGYYEKNNEVQPIFYDYEYEDNYKIISKIQKGALNFIEEYSKSIIKDMICMDCRLVSSKILRIGNYPRKEDLKMFESLDFFDIKKVKMIGELNLFRDSLKDIHKEFLISGWKVGFIKRLIYNFPASDFYCNYRKLVNREKKNEQSVTS